MKHIIFENNTKYKVALLIKDNAMNKVELEKNYINKCALPKKDIIAFSLSYNDKKTLLASYAHSYLDKLLKGLDTLGTETLVVCDSKYFKFLTKLKKVDNASGHIYPCAIKGYEHMNVILGFNYKALFFNPENQHLIDTSLTTLENLVAGTYAAPGADVIHTASYPNTIESIKKTLNSLHKHPELACDIEAYSLKFYRTDIATIAFAWDEHNGTAFSLLRDHTNKHFAVTNHAHKCFTLAVKKLLKNFFDTYKGKLIFHNGNYDIKVIVNDLYMQDLLDYTGMLKGIETLTRSIDDTKLIAYLATNSTAGNRLGLKHLSHEFLGNYSEDVTDITKIPEQELLIYNLKDCLGTMFVKKKYAPIMVADNQEDIYKNIFIPSIKTILQMELTGIPINMHNVLSADSILSQDINTTSQYLRKSPLVRKYAAISSIRLFLTSHKNWKQKTAPISHFTTTFNPGSNTQVRELIYNILKLPVIDKTDSGEPSTKTKTLNKLISINEDPLIISTLKNIIKYNNAVKIKSTFIEAFYKHSTIKSDGYYYLHGNFNLGGTVSGRLSSSGPNLQNIPSSSKYAKLIKKCFQAPKGWLMAGADFDSLEDRVSALTTKDANKLKVYTDGYDGHCLRAFAYFGDQMPDIKNTVKSINSISYKYPKLRRLSKTPTFALTYDGTHIAIMEQTGLPKEVAVSIENNYHELYKTSDEWVQNKLQEASKVGYVTVAFGLRVRTPILKQTVLNTDATPYEARKEGRTAGNALGQSYGLLNNRAAIEFQERILNSEHRENIRPIMQIHDAMYYIIKDNLKTIKAINDNLPECMAWNKLSELHHDTVKLSGSVEIFYPNWNNVITLPNKATYRKIHDTCKGALTND